MFGIDVVHHHGEVAVPVAQRIGFLAIEVDGQLDLEGRAEVKARTKELEKKLESLISDFEYQLRESVKAIDDKALGGMGKQ